MKTELFEIQNKKGDAIRGIWTHNKHSNKKTITILIHGFERCSTTEKKFKTIADNLGEDTLRFDLYGCGLSDGKFENTTITNQAQELTKVIEEVKNKLGYKNYNIVAHSLGACILAKAFTEIQKDIKKIVLIAPALNQRDLLRYRFTISQNKKTGFKEEITRYNFKKYHNEKKFQEDCRKKMKITKSNYIKSSYCTEAQELDLSEIFNNTQHDILHIHGTNDTAVPIESLNVKFDKSIIIKEGDHDLEKPYFIDQRIEKTLNFLLIK